MLLSFALLEDRKTFLLNLCCCASQRYLKFKFELRLNTAMSHWHTFILGLYFRMVFTLKFILMHHPLEFNGGKFSVKAAARFSVGSLLVVYLILC